MSRQSSRPEREVAPGVLRLRLYVAGEAPNSTAAVRNLRAALAERPEVQVELEVVDLMTSPEQGVRDGVLVTPTMIRLAPPPERRVIGNLQNRGALLAALGLEALHRE